jgi:hypothetical protein
MNRAVLVPGIYSDMPFAQYLADPCGGPSLSASIAHTLLTASPLHAWQQHPKLGFVPGGPGDDDEEKADIGSVAHEVLLGGESRIVTVEAENWRTKLAREQRDEARAQGKTPILAYRMGEVHAMVEAAHRFIDSTSLAGIFERGKGEQTLVWTESVDGFVVPIWCRARPDWLTDDFDVMLHYKTTRASARAEKFIRGIMSSMGYGLALRFYARGLRTLLADRARGTQHLILVQEQQAPFACSLIGLSPAKAEIEDARVDLAIEHWAHCLRDNQWPAYDRRIHYADPTPWELEEVEQEAGQ